MKNLGEYDRITQSIEISNDTLIQVGLQGNTKRFKKYIKSELAISIAKKLLESGYISETWMKKEYSEECTLTLYVKPLIKYN